MSHRLLSHAAIHGIYIPLGLLIIGTAIVKREWLPYAAALGLGLASYKFHTLGLKKSISPGEFRQFPLTEKTILSHNTAIYRFALPSSRHILGLPVGQHISISAQMSPGQPKPIVRSYTPISSDDSPGHFDLLIKSYPTGNVSRHIGALRIGDEISVSGPKGAMVYSPNMARHLCMIAGGTGIAPMLQIIRAVVKARPRNGQSHGPGDTSKISLLFANVTQEDILLKSDLDALDRQDPDFAVHYVLNEPPPGWTGATGFVTADLIRSHFPAPAPDVRVFICGPPPMVSAMKAATEAVGFEKARPVSKIDDQVFCF